ATPLVTALPPVLLTTNTRCEVVPVAIVPKSSDSGLTPICAGVKPTPLTALTEFPPLLLKTTSSLNVPAATGRKLTDTVCVWPGATVYGLPALTANGAGADTVPFNVTSPVLITENVCVLVCPIVTAPKNRLSGLTTNCGGWSTTIRLACVLVPAPTGPLAIKLTV